MQSVAILPGGVETGAESKRPARLVGRHILIIVENLPVPFDRRVWQEATALRAAGADVSVICPKGKGVPAGFEIRDGVAIYRHPMPIEATGIMQYLLEYSCAVFWEIVLALRIFVRHRFHVIQGCNPPDLIFIPALLFKPFGVKYVFDHHDISPELYEAKFGKRGLVHRLTVWLERLTFKTANYSIATNESYKTIAIDRGHMPADRIAVVRNGPDLNRVHLAAPDPTYKRGCRYLVGYVGVISKQEGLDLFLQAVEKIVAHRTDVHFAVVGGGTDLGGIIELAAQMHVKQWVDFHGRVSDELLVRILNTADVCVNPDTPTSMNNLSTMTKIMEYMALKKPIVQFDLKEGRFTAEDASLYARPGDVADFADKIVWLLDHPEARHEMGERGFRRIVDHLSWNHSSGNLLSFYERILATDSV